MSNTIISSTNDQNNTIDHVEKQIDNEIDENECPMCKTSFVEAVVKNCAGGHTFCFDCVCRQAKVAKDYNAGIFTCPICQTGDGAIIILNSTDTSNAMKRRCAHTLICLRDAYEAMKEDMKWENSMTVVVKPEVLIIYALNATIFRVLHKCDTIEERKEVLKSHTFNYPKWLTKTQEEKFLEGLDSLLLEKDDLENTVGVEKFTGTGNATDQQIVDGIFHGELPVNLKHSDNGIPTNVTPDYENLINLAIKS